MSTSAVRVGILGLGRSGWNIHAKALAELPDRYEIVAVADTEEERRQEAVEHFGCRAYTDSDQLLKDEAVELVVVALPSHLHASLTIAALEAGKHVVCEKPMATSVGEADAMITAARKANRILTIYQNRRYSPEFLKIREIIASGVLGRIVLIHINASEFRRRWDWQTLKAWGGGTLNNTGVHMLDLAQLLFGEETPQIYCHMERTLTLGDAEDHVKVILKGKHAPMIDIEMSSACAYPPPLWNILGTLGGLTGDTQQLRWKMVDPAQLPPREVTTRPTPGRVYVQETLEFQEMTWQAEDGGRIDRSFYVDFYETLRQGKPLVVTPESARRTIWLLEECRRVAAVEG